MEDPPGCVKRPEYDEKDTKKSGPGVKKDPVKQFSRVRCEIQTTDLKQREKGLERMIAEKY